MGRVREMTRHADLHLAQLEGWCFLRDLNHVMQPLGVPTNQPICSVALRRPVIAQLLRLLRRKSKHGEFGNIGANDYNMWFPIAGPTVEAFRSATSTLEATLQ